MAQKSAIVVGAGIVGLAVARALAVRDYQVTVIERNTKAVGASIRNFGMVWPIGQPDGPLYQRALLSQRIWKEICAEAGIWFEQKGSLHLAYHQDEMNVLAELQDIYKDRGYVLLNADKTTQQSPAVNTSGLTGSLFSPVEMVVNPTKAIQGVADWLEKRHHVNFVWGRAITEIAYPSLWSGKDEFEADEIFVCSGFDFETLYPDMFSLAPLTKCKLQMMRLDAGSELRLGPSLCGALSLLHYQAFKAASSLEALKNRMTSQYPEEIRWGVHVMISQHERLITAGDSHEYGPVHDPFDRKHINDLVLNYLATFSQLGNFTVAETWNGVYAKHTGGETEYVARPESGVTIINGLGGAGMTLSFGLCEQLIGAASQSITFA